MSTFTVKIILTSPDGDVVSIESDPITDAQEAMRDFLQAADAVYSEEVMSDVRFQLCEIIGAGRMLN